MEEITLQFNNQINVSLQKNVDDIVYFKKTNGDVLKIGKCTGVTSNSITCEIQPEYERPSASDFIFFAKETSVNTSGIIGYYADTHFEITTGDRVELYAVGAEVFVSS